MVNVFFMVTDGVVRSDPPDFADSFLDRHRLFPWTTGIVLRTIDPIKIICKGGGIVCMQGPKIFTPDPPGNPRV